MQDIFLTRAKLACVFITLLTPFKKKIYKKGFIMFPPTWGESAGRGYWLKATYSSSNSTASFWMCWARLCPSVQRLSWMEEESNHEQFSSAHTVKMRHGRATRPQNTHDPITIDRKRSFCTFKGSSPQGSSSSNPTRLVRVGNRSTSSTTPWPSLPSEERQQHILRFRNPWCFFTHIQMSIKLS